MAAVLSETFQDPVLIGCHRKNRAAILEKKLKTAAKTVKKREKKAERKL